jgi:hypothetical protein
MLTETISDGISCTFSPLPCEEIEGSPFDNLGHEPAVRSPNIHR